MTTKNDATSTRFVLLVLAGGQFLMALDSSVMNVSIRQVAADVGTTVTGVQTAITLYTLVMASLMISGSKVGSIIGRRRALGVGLVIYATGSAITAVAPSLAVLILGWSVLEGIGAALIMPAIVALIASNFEVEERPAAYGAVAAAAAIAVAVGPLLGGAVTTFASWRWVFVGEVLVAIALFVGSRRIKDAKPEGSRPLDLLGVVLSIVGLSLLVLGVLKSGEWGWVSAVPGKPSVAGTSPVIWMIGAGLFVVWLFLVHSARRIENHREPLVNPGLLRNRQVVGGLTMFFFQYLAQAGVFFTIPLFLSVVLEMSALATGLRLLPLSAALLVSALGVPRLFRGTAPRRLVRVGLGFLIVGTGLLVWGIDLDANAGVVLVPMVLLGLGIGSMASQLGAVTVSGAPASESTDVGGLQNTSMNLGASFGTALAGAVLIASLTSGLVGGITQSSALPQDLKATATTHLAGGVAFVSDSQLSSAMATTSLSDSQQAEVLSINRSARIKALDDALSVILLLELLALLFTGWLPGRALRSSDTDDQVVAS